MLRLTRFAGILAAAALALMWVAPAQAQATRTWISGVGDDANPCSRTAPCKTFPGAISKTAAGGEIDCLDPGGFGGVTITKSITLDCGGGIGGQAGSILVTGTNGITVNCASSCGTGLLVKVRNMTINGIQATGSPGLSGIKVLSNVAALIVEHVGIFGFGGSTGNNGGIDFEPSIAAKLAVLDTEIQYGLGDGILVKPQSTGIATVTLTRTTSMNNVGAGLRGDTTNVAGSATVVNATVSGSTFSGNATGIAAISPANRANVAINVTNTVVAQNNNTGLLGSGANATVRVGGSTISGNPTGLGAFGSAKVLSYGDNYFIGNTADGVPTPPTQTKL